MSTKRCQEISNLSIQILRKLGFLESFLFHYFIIKKLVCFGRGECAESSHLDGLRQVTIEQFL